MKSRSLFLNTIMSIITQIVVAVCGLILPKTILSTYGSDVNGLVASITQFLGLVAFLEFGVGAVAQSAMYKPLAENNQEELSKIMISARNYFRKIGKIFLFYIFILIIVYPILNDSFDIIYTGSLVFIISISTFAEYYFGITNQQLLNADQKSYVQLILRCVTQIVNTVICVILIKLGCSIHIVKLVTTIVFLIRPFMMELYVIKNYNVNFELKLIEEPIKQKWNGLAQHITAVVLDKTDIIILTIFSSLANVSIYSVYYLIINSLKQLINSCSIGIQSKLGNLLAKKENEVINNFFDICEVIAHFFITYVFSLCAVLIIPFVKIYTNGIKDVNYIEPLFGTILTIAYAVYCLRIFYNMVIKAGYKYKETQNSAIIEMGINIIISLITVIKMGLVGVAIGTLVAMLYRVIYLVCFLSKNVLMRPIKIFLKNIIVDFIIVAIFVLIIININVNIYNYFQLIVIAIIFSIIYLVIASIISGLFFKKEWLSFIKNNLNIIKKEKRGSLI